MIVDFPDSPAPDRIVSRLQWPSLLVAFGESRTQKQDLDGPVHRLLVTLDAAFYASITLKRILVRLGGFGTEATHDSGTR